MDFNLGGMGPRPRPLCYKLNHLSTKHRLIQIPDKPRENVRVQVLLVNVEYGEPVGLDKAG